MIKREALVRHPLVAAGAMLATASAVVFGALAIAALAGLFVNPYAGLVIFVIVPAFFVAGAALAALGAWLQNRRLRDHPEIATEWPVLDFREPRARRGALLYTGLTAACLVVLLLGGYGSLHWMESPTFCGQVCHTPMQPQFVAWQHGPHARVACVDCHIGEGAGAFVRAKLAGVRQLAHVMTGSVPKPIPPGAEMPPGAQGRTCIGCHQPWRSEGDRLSVVREYADDEGNSETVTVLQIHVGAGSASGRAIHWHADPANRVEYVATDATLATIPYVRVTNAKGEVKEYRTADVSDEVIASGTRRTVDCVDCHNTVGHPMSPTPENAVDRALARTPSARKLPFARREGLALVKAEYDSHEAAAAGIERGLKAFYTSRSDAVDPQELARTVSALQDVYRRNVFPSMKVTWGAYPTQRGHTTSNGCFRCHDDSHTAKDGSTISGDCEYCHKQIETP